MYSDHPKGGGNNNHESEWNDHNNEYDSKISRDDAYDSETGRAVSAIALREAMRATTMALKGAMIAAVVAQGRPTLLTLREVTVSAKSYLLQHMPIILAMSMALSRSDMSYVCS